MPITKGRTIVQKNLEGKKIFLPKKREFLCQRKDHSTEEFRRWIKVGDYKKRKIGVFDVYKKDGYKLPSHQSSVISHQEDNYQTHKPKYQKRREEDTCLITVDYSFDTN